MYKYTRNGVELYTCNQLFAVVRADVFPFKTIPITWKKKYFS